MMLKFISNKFIYTIFLDGFIHNTEIETEMQRKMYRQQGETGGGGMNWEIGIDIYIHIYQYYICNIICIIYTYY